MWQDPYMTFRPERQSNTAAIIDLIVRMFSRLDQFRFQSSAFGMALQSEIVHNGQSEKAKSDYGSMLYLIHSRLQQMRS